MAKRKGESLIPLIACSNRNICNQILIASHLSYQLYYIILHYIIIYIYYEIGFYSSSYEVEFITDWSKLHLIGTAVEPDQVEFITDWS